MRAAQQHPGVEVVAVNDPFIPTECECPAPGLGSGSLCCLAL